MIGFYSGSGRVAENTTKTDLNTSDASSQQERTSDKDVHNTDKSEQGTPEIPNLETRVATVTITENGSKDAHVDDKENLEQISADNGMAKCDAVNRSTGGLEWNGDTVDGGDLKWDDDDDDDGDSGWITPENFHQACEEMGGVSEEKAAGIAVGCTTTDFAMQVCIHTCNISVMKGRTGSKEPCTSLVMQYMVISLLSYSVAMAGRLQVMHLTL